MATQLCCKKLMVFRAPPVHTLSVVSGLMAYILQRHNFTIFLKGNCFLRNCFSCTHVSLSCTEGLLMHWDRGIGSQT